MLVLIVEDDEEMAQLNARLVRRQGIDVLTAHTAAKARSLVRDKMPDLIVLDVGLPDGDGFSLCKEFREDSDAPILFLSGMAAMKDKIRGLGIGGDYYLTKPYDQKELVAVIKSLLRRAEQAKKKADEAMCVMRGPITLKLNESKAYVEGCDINLTPKEFAILLLLVKNEEKELSSEYIYQNVWNAPMYHNTGTVRVHISNLKKKLEEESTDKFAIFSEQGKGYTLTFFDKR